MAKKIVVLLIALLSIMLVIGVFYNFLGNNSKNEPEPTPTPTETVQPETSTPEPTPTPIVYSSYCSDNPSMPEGTCTFDQWRSGVNGSGPGYMGGTQVDVLNADSVVQQFIVLNKKNYTAQDISSSLQGISVGGNNILIANNTDQGENPYEALSTAISQYQGSLATGGHSGYRNPLTPYGSTNGSSFCQATGTWAADGYSDHSTGLVIDLRPSGMDLVMGTGENSSAITYWANANVMNLQDIMRANGFTIRYPWGIDNQNITGYGAEFWHFRYVGVDAANALYKGTTTVNVGGTDYVINDYSTLEEYLGLPQSSYGYYECQEQ